MGWDESVVQCRPEKKITHLIAISLHQVLTSLSRLFLAPQPLQDAARLKLLAKHFCQKIKKVKCCPFELDYY